MSLCAAACCCGACLEAVMEVPFADQVMLLGAMNVRKILDVGACFGETALLYRRLFPIAEIHCF